VPITKFTAGFIVRDHLRDDFATWEKIRNRKSLRIATVDTSFARKFIAVQLPQAALALLPSQGDFKQILESRTENIDAIGVSAEHGAAWTILYPSYTMVVPRPVISLPVGYATQNRRQKLLRVVNAWLLEAKASGEIDRLHKYWVEGRTEEADPPRWSIIRNVLRWVD
jgi:ABC-type amino acid transport substrate-binding protein